MGFRDFLKRVSFLFGEWEVLYKLKLTGLTSQESVQEGDTGEAGITSDYVSPTNQGTCIHSVCPVCGETTCYGNLMNSRHARTHIEWS